MSKYLLIFVILAYLLGLFLLAYWAEKKGSGKLKNNSYIYVLSLAVYCTAWTYYGSVGIASESGINFLTIYLGPVIALPLWLIVMRKIISIAKHQKISSIADFISLRYGNNRLLGAVVTLICVFGIVPYISLQLKAISETFDILTVHTSGEAISSSGISTFYIALILAIFVTFFGTRSTDATSQRKGIITTIAFEAIIKLVFFLIIGVYVTYFLFDGTVDLYEKASVMDNFKTITSFNGLESGFNWLFTIMLSFFAIFLLPRQFHVAVVENEKISHLKTATWLFPLYLLLFNVFVIFIAWGGNLLLPESVNNDYYTLLLPILNDNTILAFIVFLGGFSAVMSMVVVSTLALSTMVSNNLVIPYGFLGKFIEGNLESNAIYIKSIRRISIFILIIAAYFFYTKFSIQLSLFSIGLMAFLVVAQLAPSFFLGLYWNRGSSLGALTGMIMGILVIGYTLIAPLLINTIAPESTFISEGLFGITQLRPYQLFGIDFLTPEAHAFYWSMIVNLFCYLTLSLSFKGDYRERNYAEMFVDPSNYTFLQEEAYVWQGEAYVSDIKNILIRFLGERRTNSALKRFNSKYEISDSELNADSRLINYSQKLLTGTIGSASARILIASVAKEKPVSLTEVLKIIEETKETRASNKALKKQSQKLVELTEQLKEVNTELVSQDRIKDEFLDTVAHELKTPITSIMAASEILTDDENIENEVRSKFLKNIAHDSKRLERLIHNLLDFEKLTLGNADLEIRRNQLAKTIDTAILGMTRLAEKKEVRLVHDCKRTIEAKYDEDRLLQVLTNLISNAIKYTDSKKGIIIISAAPKENEVEIAVEDNGKGIPAEDFKYIFDKFYQVKNQNIKKPEGSGLGLAICKKIIESHQGKIWIDKKYTKGARFVFNLPM